MIDAALHELTCGRLPANIALLQVLMRSSSADAAEKLIRAAQARADSAGVERIGAALALLQAHPGAFDLVREVLDAVDHEASAATPDEALAVLSQSFDRAAARSPGGGSALYALGDDELLARATAEVVEAMARWGLIGQERRMVEVGCGSGRYLDALAPRMATVLGLEISAAMASEARRRTVAHANAAVALCNGRSLSVLADRSVDLVLYADSFPYLVQAGGDLATRHIADCARVLKLGGQVLILNVSYRGDLDRDRRDIQAFAERAGLNSVSVHVRVFNLWDAAAFLLGA